MSLINDALKQARKTPAPPASAAPLPPAPPLPPVAEDKGPKHFWLLPTIVIGSLVLLVVVAAFGLLAWWNVRQKKSTSATATAPVVSQSAVAISAAAPAITRSPEPAPEPVNVKALPVLQGIFYSPKSPLVILDGKTVGVGDRLGAFRVAEITKNGVTLTDAGGQAVHLSMKN